jgi:hypothetical protein
VTIYLTGISIWSPGFAGARAFARGERDQSVTDCAAPWVSARLGRGSSRLTRMLGEVAAQACAHGGADRASVSTVYASGYGEIETMLVLLEAIFAGDGQLSPMRFKNSVHNAASGLGSIGTGNRGFSTAIAAGDRSFEAGMIEAIALLSEAAADPEGARELIVATADDALPDPLSRLCAREALGVGLCLSTVRPARGAIAVLDDLRQDPGPAATVDRFLDRAISPELASNPAAAALPLIAAAIRRQSARVALSGDTPRPFSIAIAPGERDALAE